MTATKQRDRNRFQPGVMELESRMAPSSIRAEAFARPSDPYQLDRLAASARVAQPTPTTAPSTRTVRTLGLADPQPNATISLARLPENKPYSLTVKLQDRNGKTYDQTFTVLLGGIPRTQMRDQIFESMNSAKWDVAKIGDTGLLIKGNKDSTGACCFTWLTTAGHGCCEGPSNRVSFVRQQ